MGGWHTDHARTTKENRISREHEEGEENVATIARSMQFHFTRTRLAVDGTR